MKPPNLTALCVLLGLAACTSGSNFRDPGPLTDAGALCSRNTGTVCSGNRVYRCADPEAGVASFVEDCGAARSCVPGQGCMNCVPSRASCSAAGVPQRCSADGTANTPLAACAAGQVCTAGQCADLCADARASNSYYGCEYWAVATLNSALGSISQDPSRPRAAAGAVGVDGFPFALVVANQYDPPANVTITGGALSVPRTQRVEGHSVATIRLPWVSSTSHVSPHDDRGGWQPQTSYATGGAYHVVSDVPLAAYQFNPLTYRDERRPSCADDDLTCYTFSNDASLLLPAHTLTGNYLGFAWPTSATAVGTQLASFSGGFLAITATAPNTQVTIRLSAYTLGGDTVPDGTPGQTLTRTMQPGDVLQLVSAPPNLSNPSACVRERLQSTTTEEVCHPASSFDLTGSVITASAPIAVFGGHDCAFVPYDRFACDHLEEQLIPSESLGQHFIISGTVPQLARGEPTLVRILSNAADNTVTFRAAGAMAPFTLQRGEYRDILVHDGVELQGTGPLAVAQYLVGQNYFSNDERLPAGTAADPSMSLEIPVEQWRADYQFLLPDTYTRSYLNVVADPSAHLALDDAELLASSPGVTTRTVGGYLVYRIDMSTRTGAHHLTSNGGQNFSIKLYGFGSYTSYMLPGGMDLSRIAPPG